jgi:hypothetical protein
VVHQKRREVRETPQDGYWKVRGRDEANWVLGLIGGVVVVVAVDCYLSAPMKLWV